MFRYGRIRKASFIVLALEISRVMASTNVYELNICEHCTSNVSISLQCTDKHSSWKLNVDELNVGICINVVFIMSIVSFYEINICNNKIIHNFGNRFYQKVNVVSQLIVSINKLQY